MHSWMETARRVGLVAVLGVAIGTLAAFAASAFVALIFKLNEWLLIAPPVDGSPRWWLAVLLVPAFGGLVAGLLHRYFMPDRRPHGPAQVIRAASGRVASGRVPVRYGIVAALASLVSLGSGASVGQYGPLVHLGASLGSLVARSAPGRGRWMGTVGMACGVAAAISTAFNAPLAGIVFAHEVILRHYSLRAFAPVTVAATAGHLVAGFVFERPLLFPGLAPMLEGAHLVEFPAFIVTGVLGALVAVVFMRAIFFARALAERLPLAAPVKPMLAGFILGVAALELPQILGIGEETLRAVVVGDGFSPEMLAILLVAKLLATALCIGFGFAGGVFSPALLIGVLFGALSGEVVALLPGESLQSGLAVYAICGMMAVTSAVIGAPLTTILIVFELTGNYELTTAVMVSVVFANLVAYRIFGRSFYDAQLLRDGFDLSSGRDRVVLDHSLIEPYVTRDFTALAPDMSLAEAKARLMASRYEEGHVLDADEHYAGSVTLKEIVTRESAGETLESVPVARIARMREPVFTAAMSITEAMERMGDFVGESIPVLEEVEEGADAVGAAAVTRERMLGVVFESAIIRAYVEVTDEVRRDEHAAP